MERALFPVRQMDVTPENVREFLLMRYSEPMTAMQLNLAELPDDFDLLLSGVIDSFGILEMINAIEAEFGIQLDLALLDAEDITKIGPLARYAAASGQLCCS
jgi:acyl carrier protein